MDLDHPGSTSYAVWALEEMKPGAAFEGGLVFHDDPPLTDEEFEAAERTRELLRSRSLRARVGRLVARGRSRGGTPAGEQ